MNAVSINSEVLSLTCKDFTVEKCSLELLKLVSTRKRLKRTTAQFLQKIKLTQMSEIILNIQVFNSYLGNASVHSILKTPIVKK